MNFWQIIRQVVHLLKARVWTGSSSKVFHTDSVVVVAGDSDINALDARLIPPMALVVPGSGQSDPSHGEEPDLIEREFSVILITRNEGDKLGQAAIMTV